jgi:uncharacterized protein YdiU (UPF0061 family)
MDNLLDDIYYKCLSHSNDNVDFADDIYANVKGVEEICKDETIEIVKQYQQKLQKSTEELSETLCKLEQERNKARSEKDTMKNIIIIRQFMNRLFDYRWDENKDELSMIDMSNLDTSFIKRKDLINRSNGTKYAIVILNDKHIDTKISKRLCLMFIKINDRFHPVIKPTNKIVKAAIDNLKQIRDNKDFKMCDINENTLKEIEYALSILSN